MGSGARGVLRISLFGVGYIGSVSAGCLARDGHDVLAVDIDQAKTEALKAGLSPIMEPQLPALIADAVAGGRLRTACCAATAVAQSEVSIICVGTPSAVDGGLDMSGVERVADEIGAALVGKAGFHRVVIRSTLTPGAMAGRIAPILEDRSGLKAGLGFGLAYYPEFLREGSAVHDYDHPSLAVAATTDSSTLAMVQALQPPCAPPLQIVGFGEAEAIKAVSNVWHGLKVSFANEVGSVLGALDIDSHRVMQAVCEDRRLNTSSAYLRPGFAFGGSCLPKDIRAFAALGQAVGRPTWVVDAALDVNYRVIEQAAALVAAAGKQRVAIIGLAFKPGADDLRESPALLLAARLSAFGCDLRLFDPNVSLARLNGANLAYANARLPHFAALLSADLEATVRHGETLVLTHPALGAQALDLANDSQRIVDLARVRPDLRSSGNYVGLYW
jgi:GDP-mannose 6-dehydrogenase